MVIRILLASILVAFAGISPSYAQATIKYQLDVPSQPLGAALATLAKQTQLQVVYATELVEGFNSSTLHGSMTREEALRQLLARTGLQFEFLDAHTVTLSQARQSDTSRVTAFPGGTPASSVAADEENLGRATQRRITLEEIVVSASKREETLQEVPGAMTALTDETLNNLGVADFQDYLPYVPGLSANPSGTTGTPGTYNVILRGLNTGSSQVTATVGYYLDDLPLTPSSSNSTGGQYAIDPSLGDVERIEVLKGPQATLYGASTLGGLIKIVSKKPDLTTFGGNISASGVSVSDGDSGYSARAAVNIPLIQDTLAARLSGYYRDDPGYTDNVDPISGADDINSAEAYGARLSLRYAPTENLDFNLTGLIQKLESPGNTFEFLDQQTLQPIYGDAKYSSLSNTTTQTQLTVFSLTASYDTGWGTLTNASGYGRFYAHYEHFPFTTAFAPILPMFRLTSPPVAIEGVRTIPQTQKLSNELRFTSIRMNDFVWQGGLFYTDEDVDQPRGLVLVSYPGGALVPAPFNPLLVASQAGTYREYAGFGNLTYYFTEALDATVGVRYSHNDQDAVNTQAGALAPPGGAGNVSASSTDSDVNYLFDMRWRASEQLSTYLRAASAYRPGGPQTVVAPGAANTFGPDTAWNYEVGAKGRWLEGRLNANLAVYYIDWSDIQIGTIVGSTVITDNGGDAKSEGVEFDGAFEPVRGLIFGANASFNETEITAVNPTNTAGARIGDPLPYTPKWSGAFTGDYRFPIGPNVQGGVGASWAYKGERFNSFSGDLNNTRVVLPSYSVVGFRGYVGWSQYSLTLNVDNAANKRTFSNVTFRRLAPGQPVPGFGYPIQPRTYRLTLNVNF